MVYHGDMKTGKRYTISQLASYAGVSTRTLRYYDQIGLLSPAAREQNTYRTYRESELLRLQQILFFRELSFDLESIKAILQNPDFDLPTALEQHRRNLELKARQTLELIQTIDKTIESLKGTIKMDEQEFFKGFSDEKQAEYQKYAEEHWDSRLVNQSTERWQALSKEGRQALLADGGRITREIIAAIPLGAGSPQVQELVGQWHAYINRFYDCSPEILLGLGNAYVQHPDFHANYRKMHPAMPEFLTEAIRIYCAARGVTGE